MRTSTDIRGLDRAIAKLGRLQRTLPADAAEGMKSGAQTIFSISQATAPTLTNVRRASHQSRREAGRLAASGRLGRLTRTVDPKGEAYQIRISYGPSRYTRIQHYNSKYHHKPGEKARWLTDPFYAMKEIIIESCRAEVRRAIELSV